MERKSHYAMIGMAYVADDYPLYYDAVNEKGLGMAGLNFVGNAKYQDVQTGRENVARGFCQVQLFPQRAEACLEEGCFCYTEPLLQPGTGLLRMPDGTTYGIYRSKEK